MKTSSRPRFQLKSVLTAAASVVSLIFIATSRVVTAQCQVPSPVLYVTDYMGQDIEYFPLGNGSGTVFVPFILTPTGMVFTATGTLLVASASDPLPQNNMISSVDSCGNVTLFSNNGVGHPHGMKFDSSGNLFVTTAGGLSSVIEFAGGNGNVTPTTFADASDGLVAPVDLLFDSQGNLFVSDPYSNAGSVIKFNSSGTKLLTITFAGAYGLAFDSAGKLYVSSQTGNSVERFNSVTGADAGTFIPNDGTLKSPLGIVFDASGFFYVANRDKNTIEKYDNHGVHKKTIGPTAKKPHFLVIH